MSDRGKLFVGTSGFAYKEWKGPFYPEETKDRDMLTLYSERLPSVEINYTFRRLPSESTIEKWKTDTSDDFRFTLKASQRITHFKRLKDVQEDVDEFVRRARGLGEKLGTILFQLPPNMAFEANRLEEFLSKLPPVTRYAMEYRHESWNDPEVDRLLQSASVARCGAETEDAAVDQVPVTAHHVYLRLRKLEYADDELTVWSQKISKTLDAGHDVYCYFKHEGGGIGPAYAQKIKELSG